MLTIQGQVPGGAKAALEKELNAYAQANPALAMVPNLEFTVKGADGPVTVKGALQRVGVQLVFIVVKDVVAAVKERLSRRQQVKAGKSRRMPPALGGASAGDASGAQDTPEQQFNNLQRMGMIRPKGDGFEMAGKPPIVFADKAAVLAHLGGKAPEPAPKKQARTAKKAARKVAKAAKKVAKAAKKAARKR